MAMKKILVSFIQDRSGSMRSAWHETLSGFETYVSDLQKDQAKDSEVEYLFSLTTFDTQIDTPYVAVPLAQVDGTRLMHFGPRGLTALYDGVGVTLQKLDEDKGLSFDKAIVVIVTDGEENSSREWTKDTLHTAIDERIKRGNWTFTYLGTQPETWNDAQKVGIAAGSSASYNAANADATYSTMASATMDFARSVQPQSLNFLHENLTRSRREAVGMRTQDDAQADMAEAMAGMAPSNPPPAKNKSRRRDGGWR
jgi:hypothetical protein